MKKLFKVNLNHILVPFSILVAILLILLRGQSVIQYALVVVSALVYVLVGLLHHHFDKSLTFEIVVEYILIAVLVLIILQGLLL